MLEGSLSWCVSWVWLDRSKERETTYLRAVLKERGPVRGLPDASAGKAGDGRLSA
jgi:hypothetical protein